MFEKFLRKTILSHETKEDQESLMLLKEKFKCNLIAVILVSTFPSLALAALITTFLMQLKIEHTILDVLLGIVMIIAYLMFIVYFIKKFYEQINYFITNITNQMYCLKYVISGNAITEDNWKTIKEKDDFLYTLITNQNVSGYCFATCFDILKCLKKGEIKFIAIKALEKEKVPNYYTMHVVYVNNDWCFDTFSMRQYPLNKVMKVLKAKEYKTFAFKDIEENTFEEFKKQIEPELKEWCKNNDCFLWTKE